MIEQDLGKEVSRRMAHDDRRLVQPAHDPLEVLGDSRDSESINR
ncbi:hypothetical protein ACFVTE_18925 [Arthrobacter sp. NPDC058097]